MFCLKTDSDVAEVMSDDSSFQRLAPEIGKVRLPTVVRRKVGAIKCHMCPVVTARVRFSLS